jgi:hypothetical protein
MFSRILHLRQTNFSAASVTETSFNPTPQHVGKIFNLREVIDSGDPESGRVAKYGKGVFASYNEIQDPNNYLCSFNAKESVIVFVYNKINQRGAVVHFEDGTYTQIRKTIQTIVSGIGGSLNEPNETIQATMVGGIWPAPNCAIGRPVQDELRAYEIPTRWNQWSYTCFEHNYGGG